MLSLAFLFWMFVILFALIGAMRGWAREMLVSFSVILALFSISVFERFVPFVRDTITGESRFWFRAGLTTALVLFGYQTPNFPRLAQSNRFIREHFQDILLGFVLGGLNGYLVFGSIWFYLHDAGYPFPYITAPTTADPLGQAAMKLIAILPPTVLGSPFVYFATAIAFVFVLVVFL